MSDILKLVRLQILLLVVFIICKVTRPSLLETGLHKIVKSIFLSLPNFFEGCIGVLLLSGILLYLKRQRILRIHLISDHLLYLFALLLAAIYVLTQEFKIHNIGGTNVFDINDVLFSIIGVVLGYSIVLYLKPTTTPIKH